MSLIPAHVHPSWHDFLDAWAVDFLNDIEKELDGDTNPDREHMLRFLTTDLATRKVVLLGQDPYPEKGVATGRAFEVGGLDSWTRPFRQVSLKNMVRLIYKASQNIEDYAAVPTFRKILEEMGAGRFQLAEPCRLFKSWEEQGVLLLNIWFSVKPSQPGSHRTLWQPFSERLIAFISKQRPDLIWFLWGKGAMTCKAFIQSGTLYECRHPMMCSEAYEDDFLKSSCMKDTLSIIDWKGK